MYKEILRSKPNNKHYLDRYIKFIEYFIQNPPCDEYLESHHICPKARDLFPEYEDFKNNPWNRINLSSRQHIIAHVLLWKAYGRSQIDAVHFMVNVQNSDTISICNRKVPTSISIHYAEKIRIEHYKNRLGKSTYKDSNGNKYFIHRDDPLIQELNLVGNNMGNIMTEETRERQRRSKDKNRKITIYSHTEKKKVKINSNEFQELINSGWSIKKPQEYLDHVKKCKYEKSSKSLSGKYTYYYPNGKLYGRISVDSPEIKELGLTIKVTENKKKQWKRRSEAAVMANSGTNIYNNGIEERKFKEAPEDKQWILGRLPRSEEYSNKHISATIAANSNKKYWNNGVICIKLPVGEFPEGDNWIPGMLPRKKVA